MAALTTGKVDATVIGSHQTPVPDSAKDRIKVVADEDKNAVPFIGGAFFARQDFLTANKPALTRFLAAVGQGADWGRAHPDQAIPACQDTGGKADDCKVGIAIELAAT